MCFIHSFADLIQALQLIKGEVFAFFLNIQHISNSLSPEMHGVIIKLVHMQKNSTSKISKSTLVLFSNYCILDFITLMIC